MDAAMVLWVCGMAMASRPPPDYRQELHQTAAAQVEHLANRGDIDGAFAFGERFVRRVEQAPAVLYEMALLHNRMGQYDQALPLYDMVLSIDADHAAARYDRGELLLARGDISRAQRDLEAAARLAPNHWVVHFRLAELAAEQQNPTATEMHLLNAVRHGFALETLEQSPSWMRWLHDPELGPVITRIVLMYGEPSLLDRLLNTSPVAPR